MKLGIGTVQWGLPYGVSNANGVPSRQEILTILSIAQHNGVRILDTAFQYGSSEERIGQTLPARHAFRIITKTPSFKANRIEKKHAEQLVESFQASLGRLAQPSIEGLLLHHTPDLFVDEAGHLWKALLGLKEKGLVKKIGISVYTGEELDQALARVSPDIVQLPFNLLDQRLLRSGHLSKLKDRAIEVHARSIFLQGLLLMSEKDWPAFFRPWHAQLARCREFVQSAGMTPLEGALQFALQNTFIDCVLVGAASAKEFEQIISAAHVQEQARLDWASVASQDEMLLNPARWRMTAS